MLNLSGHHWGMAGWSGGTGLEKTPCVGRVAVERTAAMVVVGTPQMLRWWIAQQVLIFGRRFSWEKLGRRKGSRGVREDWGRSRKGARLCGSGMILAFLWYFLVSLRFCLGPCCLFLEFICWLEWIARLRVCLLCFRICFGHFLLPHGISITDALFSPITYCIRTTLLLPYDSTRISPWTSPTTYCSCLMRV